MMAFDFNTKTVLVTGGTRGIGREIVRQIVGLGGRVVIVGRNQRDIDTTLEAHKGKVVGIQADLSDPAEVDRLILQIIAEHPTLSVLVNNAGIQVEVDLFSGKASQHITNVRREISVNLDAPIALTIGLLPLLKKQNQAVVVNISSGLAIAPKEASPVYCATKAALRSFSKALRYQCNTSAPNISVVEGIMALVETEMTQGRGSGKISAEVAATSIIQGVRTGKSEVWVGKARLLRIIDRISPALSHRILR